MNFLHPVFTILLILLIVFTFMEVNENRKHKSFGVVVAIMIVLVGLRAWAGADYPVYWKMYEYYSETLSYTNIVNREYLDIEWLYVLMGKFFYDIGFPFHIFTLVLAIISIGLKYKVFAKDSLYPSLSMLLYMFPSYFTADGGHMRQAVAMAIMFFSFQFIKQRRLLPFLFMFYIALGFHKSAFTFLIAYWLVLIPLNSTRIIILIASCIILSPLKIYENIGVLEMIAPAEVYESFNAYAGMENEEGGSVIKLMDLICLMYAYFIIAYDKVACNKILYYEYMRNLGVVGICLYFIFRGSPIYSSRLVGYYLLMFMLILPNIIGAIPKLNIRKNSHIVLVLFAILYYFVYATMQAPRMGYDMRYSNFLWDF